MSELDFDIVDGIWRTAPTRVPPRHLLEGNPISCEAWGIPPWNLRPPTPRPDEDDGPPPQEAPRFQWTETDGVSAQQDTPGPLSPQGNVTNRSAANSQNQHDASDNRALEPPMTGNTSKKRTTLSESSGPETSTGPERSGSPTEASTGFLKFICPFETSTGLERLSSPTEASTGTEKPNSPTETCTERLSSPTETEADSKSPGGSTETSVGPQKRSNPTEAEGPKKRAKLSHVGVSANSEAAEVPKASTDVK